MSLLDVIVQIMSKPSILVGLIAMVGLLSLKKPFEIVVSGTLKTIIGFIILGGGAGIVISAILPLGDLMMKGFGLQGALPVNEVFVAEAQKLYGTQISLVFFFAFLINLILARFTPMKYVFLTGHHTLFAATLVTGILGLTVFKGAGSEIALIAVSALIVGFMMVFFPWLSAPFMEKVIGTKDFVMGHFGTTNYVLSGWLGEKIGDPKESTENIKFPAWIGFMREPLIAMGFVMFIIYLIAAIAAIAAVGVQETMVMLGSGDAWWLTSFILALTFAGGVGVILLGVRMILADIVPAFRGFAEKIVPNATPALDCPVVFPYGQNAVLVGYISSIVGGLVALGLQIAVNGGATMGLLGGVILPSMIIHFFVGGTSGVFGNATGGWKGSVLGGFLTGLLFTLLAGTALRAIGAIGIPNSTFGDTDFGVVGSILAFITGLFK
jgi:PTS system ascorbate-specific IIC component